MSPTTRKPTTTTTARRTLAAAAVTGLLAAGLTATSAVSGPASPAAATTAPGAIVYIKDNNVWLADGDGARDRQVTTDGTPADPWQSPTQSDAGVVVAHHGGLIYRMNQRGEVFNVIDPPDLPDTIGNRLSGRDLQHTAVSPDGTRIAYSYFKVWGGEKRWTTGFTAATGATDPDRWGIEFYGMPSWVTNDRVVLNHWYRNRTHLYDLAQRDIPWFDERSYRADAKDLSELEVSRDGTVTAATRGDVGDESVVVLKNGGDPRTTAEPAAPVAGCEIGPEDNNVHQPTIAPDSGTVAWAEPDGIWRIGVQDCLSLVDTQRLFIPGGSDPSWSAATVGVTPAVPTTDDGPRGTPGAFVATRPAKLTGKARTGRVLKVRTGTWSPAPAQVSIRWLRNHKPVKRATKASYRVTKKDRGKRISVRLTLSKPGLPSTTWTSTQLKVRR